MSSGNRDLTTHPAAEQALEKKPFVEPEISPAENVLDVTSAFAFQVFTVDTGDN